MHGEISLPPPAWQNAARNAPEVFVLLHACAHAMYGMYGTPVSACMPENLCCRFRK